MYETRAIARYIEAKYPSQGTKLIPSTKDLKVIALFEQAVSVEVSNFDPHVSDVVDEGLFKPYVQAACASQDTDRAACRLRGLGRDEAAYEKHMVKLEQSLGVYEKILSKQRYVAGDVYPLLTMAYCVNTGICLQEFTMADIFHIPYGALVAHTGSDVTTRNPNVARWWLEIASRPSWTAMADGIVSTASQK